MSDAHGGSEDEQSESSGVDARLKWPNDVLVDGRKIAGVLTEAVVDAVLIAGKPVDQAIDDSDELGCAVLGIGVNAALDPSEFDTDRAVATLRAETGGSADRTEVAVRLHERVLQRATQVETDDGFADLLDDWRELSVTLGERVRIGRRDGETLAGTAVDVDATGALLVKTADGEKRVTEGDCERLRRD